MSVLDRKIRHRIYEGPCPRGREANALRAVLELHPHEEVSWYTVNGRPMRRCKACGPTRLNQDWCETVAAIARELGLSVEVSK